MTGVKGWFSHPSTAHSAPNNHHPPAPAELGGIVAAPPAPAPAPTGTATARHRRWSWRHSHPHSHAHSHPPSHPPSAPSTGPPSSFPTTFAPATPTPAPRRAHSLGLTLAIGTSHPHSPSHPTSPGRQRSAPASLTLPSPTTGSASWHTVHSEGPPPPNPPSLRRRRAPSMTRPLHPTGQTRFKPGTRPTWRFLKNLRPALVPHAPVPLPATKRWHEPQGVKGKGEKAKGEKAKGEKGAKDKAKEPASASTVPVPDPGAEWETEPTEAESKRFSLKSMRRRRDASPRTSRPTSPTSPRPSVSPERAALGLGAPSRPKAWHRTSRPTSPASRTSRPTSPTPLTSRSVSRPASPANVHRLASASTMATFISTATSSPSASQTTLPIARRAPRSSSPVSRISGPRAVAEAREAERTRAVRRRSASTTHIVLGAVFGCALALSPWPAVAAALVVVVAAILAALSSTVRERGADAWRVCGEAGHVVVVALWRWSQDRRRGKEKAGRQGPEGRS